MLVQIDLNKKWNPISKITRAKRDGGVAQVVEHLPSKHKAMNSNLNTSKEKKKKTLLKETRQQGQSNTISRGTLPSSLVYMLCGIMWRADYEKPMRTGHKQGETQLSCFSWDVYLQAEIGTALATEEGNAEQLLLLSCLLRSEKQERRFLLLQCHTSPWDRLLHPVYHWI
jgi:hypothetical protein